MDDFARYVVILLLATLISLIYKFIFWSSEKALEWRIELMEHYLGIASSHGEGGGGHRRNRSLLDRAEAGHSGTGDMVNPNFAAAYFSSVGTSLLFVLPAAAAIAYFKPAAAGAGMPEVIAFLNGNLQTRAYEFSTLVLKVVGSICIVSSGLMSGFDGPMIHIGAIVAYLIVYRAWAAFTSRRDGNGKVGSLANFGLGTKSLGLTMKNKSHVDGNTTIRRQASFHEYVEVRDSELQKRTLDFATLGACAALSSAFRAPLAAVTFALEEAISHFDPTFISRALVVAIWAFVMISFLNKIDWFNPFSFSIWSVNATCAVRTEYIDIFLWIAMGLAGGVTGYFYNMIVTWIRLLRTRLTWPARPGRALLDVLAVVFLSMAIIVFLPMAFDTCTPATRLLDHLNMERDDCLITCVRGFGNESSTTIDKKCHLLADTVEDGDRVCMPDETKNVLTYLVGTEVSFVASQVCPFLPENTTTVFDPFNETSSEDLSAQINIPFIKTGTFIDPVTGQSRKCYYQMRSLLWNIPENVLQNLFLRGVYKLFSWEVLLTFSFAYIVLAGMVNGIVLPTDLVIPNLIIGASFGRLIGLGVDQIKQLTGSTLVDPGLYAQLGMAGFWAGTSRMTITVALVALETTFELTYVPAVLIVVTVATITGNALGPALYHLEIQKRNIPYLDSEPPLLAKKVMAKMAVAEIMSSPVGVIISLKPTAGDIRKALRELPDASGFPVVDDTGGLLGLVLRKRLEQLVAAGTMRPDPVAVDISTAMNPSPTVVPSTCSVLKAYITFRSLKLRHMVVVDSHASGKVVGVVTRRNLVDAEHHAHEAAHGHGRKEEGGHDHGHGHGEVNGLDH